MLQNIYSKNYQINPNFKQVNPILNINQNNKEICSPRINSRKSSDSKKSVSFNPRVSITEVESWKKYNSDMSKETEFYNFKKEFMALRAKKRLENKKLLEGCNCIVF